VFVFLLLWVVLLACGSGSWFESPPLVSEDLKKNLHT
jgi:hypothetical protein